MCIYIYIYIYIYIAKLLLVYWPNLVIESSVHSSLHSSCHHQIAFAKFNLKICYPSPYSRIVWHFEEEETDLIRRSLNDFNWEIGFSNTNVNEKVFIFNKQIPNHIGAY